MITHQPEDKEAESKYILILLFTFSQYYAAPASITSRDATEPFDASITRPTAQAASETMSKRKEAPATTSTETTVATKKVKVEGSSSRGRVRTADFGDLTRSIIEETISIYHAQISCVEPFPERTDDRKTIKQAWLEVCTGRNLRVELDEDIF